MSNPHPSAASHADPLVWRRNEVVLCIEGASNDKQFRTSILMADAARDSCDWLTALRGYVDALIRAPLHAGYAVQAGHCLKEMGRMADAELCYRDAVALGAPKDDVMKHLAFVSRRDGYGGHCYPSAVQRALDGDVVGDAGIGEAAFRLKLATSHDARLLLTFLLNCEDLSDGKVLSLLREAPCIDDLLGRLILDDAFVAVNGPIVRLASIRLAENANS